MNADNMVAELRTFLAREPKLDASKAPSSYRTLATAGADPAIAVPLLCELSARTHANDSNDLRLQVAIVDAIAAFGAKATEAISLLENIAESCARSQSDTEAGTDATAKDLAEAYNELAHACGAALRAIRPPRPVVKAGADQIARAVAAWRRDNVKA